MGKTALIIDDNKANRDVLQMMLKANGVTPIALESPRYLDRAFSEGDQFDVVFLDLEFPNYDGLELIHSFKADARLRASAIIAYTVHTNEVHAMREAGFDGFLGKPLNPRLFTQQLERILKGESVWEY